MGRVRSWVTGARMLPFVGYNSRKLCLARENIDTLLTTGSRSGKRLVAMWTSKIPLPLSEAARDSGLVFFGLDVLKVAEESPENAEDYSIFGVLAYHKLPRTCNYLLEHLQTEQQRLGPSKKDVLVLVGIDSRLLRPFEGWSLRKGVVTVKGSFMISPYRDSNVRSCMAGASGTWTRNLCRPVALDAVHGHAGAAGQLQPAGGPKRCCSGPSKKDLRASMKSSHDHIA
jgi:hypothetical protein